MAETGSPVQDDMGTRLGIGTGMERRAPRGRRVHAAPASARQHRPAGSCRRTGRADGRRSGRSRSATAACARGPTPSMRKKFVEDRRQRTRRRNQHQPGCLQRRNTGDRTGDRIGGNRAAERVADHRRERSEPFARHARGLRPPSTSVRRRPVDWPCPGRSTETTRKPASRKDSTTRFMNSVRDRQPWTTSTVPAFGRPSMRPKLMHCETAAGASESGGGAPRP